MLLQYTKIFPPPAAPQGLRAPPLITFLKCFLMIYNFAKWSEFASREKEPIRETAEAEMGFPG